MLSGADPPDEAYWLEVGGDRRMHPYGMHKTVNRPDVEVVHSETDSERHPRRWVLVRDGRHQVWVLAKYADEYGYDLQPEERVSAAERHAIALKQRAIREGASVPVSDARHLVEHGTEEQLPHALVALYYAAKADPAVPETDVDELREYVREQTGHVDTSHVPTVKRVLEGLRGDE